MRVALVHDWLVTSGGAERVLETLTEMFPDAPIFTGVVDRRQLSPRLQSRKIVPSFVQKMPRSRRWYNRYLPFLMYAFEQFDLSSYDLVISSSAAVAKGVLTSPETVHVAYIHTPMRYAWDMYHEYRNQEAHGMTKILMGPIFHYVRMWDRLSADRADVLVANSHFVQKRIWKHYRRPSEVVYPPVSVERFRLSVNPGSYYLVLSRLVAYKRIDLAVLAAKRMGIKLLVAGDGPERVNLRQLAGPGVEFVGAVTDDTARDLIENARGLIFPGQEDFGIVPVEMQAAGHPVVAYGRGGVLDTVIDGKTGVLFDCQDVDAVIGAIRRAEDISWNPQSIRHHAYGFRPEVFETNMSRIIDRAIHSSNVPAE
ncbi:MAG: glycosyltransferase [Firmicutes bacterium]|jgi:glycosyltransferase involved in cell wall biosynthesis|uniref:Glycosyltransferase family 4 protein n=1 Tax=Sulfobacillus benefaciens TaxID=453960 RepID=A0A2T2X781_9FIRM|nr:glycosyltransferase [Bacillota bacterium]MCL5012639.1 glycosyltransferase [Bacillota bacterium]PSR30364.1 MAG: glycosyltransferase family 4 protein [Sulfobacillus benefaciens]